MGSPGVAALGGALRVAYTLILRRIERLYPILSN